MAPSGPGKNSLNCSDCWETGGLNIKLNNEGWIVAIGAYTWINK